MFKNIAILSFFILSIFFCAAFCEGIVYEFEYNGEPAGDVTRFDQYGNQTTVEMPEIDLKRFETHNGTGDNLTFELRTKAKRFTVSPDVKYVFRIFTESNNQSGYNITFSNGTIEIVKIIKGTEQTPEDITDLGGIVVIKNEDVLVIDISKIKYIPEDELTYFAVDAFSWMEEGNYTYVDYISNLPGHPGTIAPDVVDDTLLDDTSKGKDEDEKEGSETLTFALIGIIIAIIIIVALLVVAKRKKK